jgi:hypothetical protein
MKRRNLILILGGTSVGSLTIGSGAFSSVTADRDVDINTVPDNQALVGYEVKADEDSDGDLPEIVFTSGESEKRTLVRVKNRVGEEIKLTDVDINTDLVEIEWDDETFDSGHYTDIRGIGECDSEESATVELTVSVEGAGLSVQLFGDTKTRRFTIRCEDEGNNNTREDDDTESIDE